MVPNSYKNMYYWKNSDLTWKEMIAVHIHDEKGSTYEQPRAVLSEMSLLCPFSIYSIFKFTLHTTYYMLTVGK